MFMGSLEEYLRKAEQEWKRVHYGWARVEPALNPRRRRPPDISSLFPCRELL